MELEKQIILDVSLLLHLFGKRTIIAQNDSVNQIDELKNGGCAHCEYGNKISERKRATSVNIAHFTSALSVSALSLIRFCQNPEH
mgnify:CR=1 FL=1